MAYTPPARGQLNWDTDLNASLDALHTASSDAGVAGYVNDSASSTRAALDKGYERVVTPQAYGAVGNGTADDTSAIQSAINAAGAGVVYFPAGAYKITSTLVVSNPYLQLRGAGYRLRHSYLLAGTSGMTMLRISATYVRVSELELDGNGTAAVGILLHNAGQGEFAHVSAHNCTAYGWKADISATTPTGNNNLVKLWHCYGEFNGVGFGVPAYQSDNNAIDFYSCEFSSNTSHGLQYAGCQSKVHGGEFTGNGGYGIMLGNSADAAGTTRDNSLFGPYVEANTGGGIGVAAASVVGGNALYGEVTQGLSYSLTHGVVHVGWDVGSGAGRIRLLNGVGAGMVFDGHNVIVTDPSGNGNMDLYAQGTGAIVSRSDHYLLAKAGFNGATPIAKPTVTGAKGGNAALTSLLAALASYGLITDSTT